MVLGVNLEKVSEKLRRDRVNTEFETITEETEFSFELQNGKTVYFLSW